MAWVKFMNVDVSQPASSEEKSKNLEKLFSVLRSKGTLDRLNK